MTQAVSQALARKWRPRDFPSLVGQSHVVQALSHALDSGRLHHAYLLTGTRGVGKTTIARILAKAVNCEKGLSSNPCGICQACTEIAQGRFVDLLEVDAATNTKVDEMRQLLENAMYAPTAGRYKVYVIDEVHMLSNSAFNAMLKTLEEPPGHVLFILATTDPQKIPATVLSRCLQFGLRQLVPDQIAEHLQHILTVEGVQFESAAVRLLAKAARGSLRDALSLTDQAIAFSAGHLQEESVRTMLGAVDQKAVLAILHALADSDGAALVDLNRSLSQSSAPFAALLDELAAASYRLSVAALTGLTQAEDPDEAALLALLDRLHPEMLQLIYQIATHARAELHWAPEPHVGFGMALLRMLAFKPGGGDMPSTVPGRAAKQATLEPKPTPKVVAPKVTPQALSQPVLEPQKQTEVPMDLSVTSTVVAPVSSHSTPPVALPNPNAGAQANLPTAAEWPSVSQQVPAKGLTRQALVQTELLAAESQDGVWTLRLQTAIKAYSEASMTARMESALSDYFGCTVRLVMQTGQVVQTAAAVQSENRKQALEDARDSIDNDPFVRDVKDRMGGSVVQGSQRPLQHSGPADV